MNPSDRDLPQPAATPPQPSSPPSDTWAIFAVCGVGALMMAAVQIVGVTIPNGPAATATVALVALAGLLACL